MSKVDVKRSQLYGNQSANGHWFDDSHLYSLEWPRIKELRIWHVQRVHGIHVFYSNGTSGYHGTAIGSGSSTCIRLSEDESVICIEGHALDLMDQMTIHTTKRKYGPFGSVTSKHFSCDVPKGREIKYFFGRFASNHFSSVGFAHGPIPQKEPMQTLLYGAKNGEWFNDRELFEHGTPSITAVTVFARKESYIEGVQVEYSNGKRCTHGNVLYADADRNRFDIGVNDYITGVRGLMSWAMDQIEFITFKRGALGPVGKKGKSNEKEIAKNNFYETFPSGSRLLYLEGYTDGKLGLQGLHFWYGCIAPVESLVYSKSELLNDLRMGSVVFDSFEHTNGGRKKIQKVRVYADNFVGGLQVMVNGQWFPTNYSHGYKRHTFELDDDEYLVKVSGRRANQDCLSCIVFHTSKSRESPVYGQATGGNMDYSLESEGSVIAAFYGRKDGDSVIRQFGAIFVSGLVARVDIRNVRYDLENKVEKLGNPFLIGRSLLENNTDIEQQMSVDIAHLDLRSEVVTTGQPFSSSVVVSDAGSSSVDFDHVEGAMVGKNFLFILAQGDVSRTTKENVIHVMAKVPPGKAVTATAYARNLVVVVPYTADCILHHAGATEIKDTSLSGTYTSGSAQIRVKYDKGASYLGM